MGGGKGGTTVQKTEIPPEVMARYNAVNARAEQVAQKPFQQYQGQFVAPLTGTQTGAIQNIRNVQGMVDPYYGAGAALTMSGAQGVGPLSQRDIAYYQSPYTEAVAAPTYAALRQQQGQELAQQQANAIRSGAAFGERSGLERANLMRQQALGTAQAIAPIYQQGYSQAAQIAAGQQGVLQQDQARRLAAGQQIAGLGTGLQGAALQQAQAQLAAGTAEQQTKQADLTARYQQFLQERGYDFQTAQFLANIAMGTGALSGSTTTTQAPMPFFSDRRLKKDVEKIGHTKDDLPVYEFRYKGEEERGEPHVGYMAQDVEKKYPDAVGLAGGYKTVDYNRVAQHQDEKGLGAAMDRNWMGGAVHEPGHFERGGYARGGLGMPNIAADDMQSILQAQRQSFGPFASAGPYGQPAGEAPFGKGQSIVPKANLPVVRLQHHGAPPRLPEGAGAQTIQALNAINTIDKSISGAADIGRKIGEKTGIIKKEETPSPASPPPASTSSGPTDSSSTSYTKPVEDPLKDFPSSMSRGGLAPHRAHYLGGGGINPYDPNKDPATAIEDVVDEGSKSPQELLGQQKGMAGQGGGAGGSGGGGLLGAASTIGSLYGAAKGIGALMSFLPSDARLKDNIRPVGKTFDGQNIYAYDMGDGQTQLGLMAQEVMQRKPEAVGERDGYLTLNYDKATEDATPREGGVMPRHGAQEGGRQEGGMSEEEFNRTLARAAEITRLKESGKREGNYQIAGEVIPSGPYAGDRAYGAYQVMGKNIGPWTEKYLGRRMTIDEFRNDKQAQDDLFNAVWGGNLRRYGNVPDAVSIWASGQPLAGNRTVDLVSGKPTSGYVSNFMKLYDPNSPLASAQESGAPRPPGNIPPDGRSPTPPSEGGIKGFWSENKGTILPILAGLGSMAQSRSPFLAGALLEGIGGGARAYADINRELAETQRLEAQLPGDVARSAQQFIDTKGGVTRIFVPSLGRWVNLSEYEDMGKPGLFGIPQMDRIVRQNLDAIVQQSAGASQTSGGPTPPPAPSAPAAPGAAPSTTGAPATTTTGTTTGAPATTEPSTGFVYRVKLDDEANRAANNETRQLENMTEDARRALESTNKAYRERVTQRATGTREYTPDLNLLTASLLPLATSGGGLTTGVGIEARTSAANVLNTMARMLKLDDSYQIKGASDKEAADKAQRILAATQVAGFNQSAVESLKTVMAGTPGATLNPAAVFDLLASMRVNSQRALDEAAYMRNYTNRNTSYLIGSQAEANFNRQFNAERYDRDKKRLADFYAITNSAGKPLYNAIMESLKDPAKAAAIKQSLAKRGYDEEFQRYLFSTTF